MLYNIVLVSAVQWNESAICIHISPPSWGFPGGADGKESARNAGELGSIPGSGRSPEKGMATHSSIIAWRIPWQRSVARYSPWGRKELD